MNIQEEHIDLFNAYLQNTLSEQEVKEFDARLVYDSEFKEHFETYQQVEKGITQHFRNEVKEKFKQIDSELDKETKIISINSKSKLKRLYLAIGSVAAALIVGIVIHFSTQNTSQNIASQYWPTEEGLPVKMSGKGKFDAAMNTFKMQQWNKAETLFKQINSDTSMYFIGIINYQQKEFENAVVSFEKIPTTSAWHQEAEFRLALVYLQLGEVEKAKAVLKKIEGSNAIYSKNVATILNEL